MVVLLISLFGHYFYVERAYAIAPLVRLGAGAVASEGVDAVTNEITEKIVWSFATDKTSYTLESSQKMLDGVNKRLGDYEAWMLTEEGQEWKNDVNEKWAGAGWEGDDIKVPETREELIKEATKTVVQDESLGKKVVIRGIGGLVFLDIVYDVYQQVQAARDMATYLDAEQASINAGTRLNGLPPGYSHQVVHLESDNLYAIFGKTIDSTLPVTAGTGTFTDYPDLFLIKGYYDDPPKYFFSVKSFVYGTGTTEWDTIFVNTHVEGDSKITDKVYRIHKNQLFDVLTPSSNLPNLVTDFPDGILPKRDKSQTGTTYAPLPFKPYSPDSYPDKIIEIPISPITTEVTQPAPTTVKDPTPQDDPNGLPKPAPEPDPEPSPNPEVKPNPLPTPIPTPVPVPQFPDPVPDLDDPPDDDDKRRFEDFKNLATSKFPFSLPWDLAYMVSALNAEPKTPHFKMDIDGSILGIKFPFDIDHNMSYLNGFMPFFRGLIVVGYCFMLILLTRQILGGGS